MNTTATPPVRLLIVDDEPDIGELLSYNFRKRGFDVRTATDGRTGMDAARAFHPDIIILDIMMPHVNGIAMCKELKSTEDLSSIPVLFLSATANDLLIDEALQAGGYLFVSKPIQLNMLIQVVVEMKDKPDKRP
ncbi:MAG TPA: response regulator [Bacteroidia bacterium]|nr:response regulator [Bacteroidia bacterium]